MNNRQIIIEPNMEVFSKLGVKSIEIKNILLNTRIKRITFNCSVSCMNCIDDIDIIYKKYKINKIKNIRYKNKRVTFQILGQKLNRMSRANLGVFEANLLASLPNLQQILNFYLLRNLASNELFFCQNWRFICSFYLHCYKQLLFQ